MADYDEFDAPTNPRAGLPITDDDATIARMLEDVSVPTLVLSLVHMTGSADSRERIVSQCGGDAALVEKVAPKVPPTGKRTLQDDGSWLQASTRENVERVDCGIDRERRREDLHPRALAAGRLLGLGPGARSRGARDRLGTPILRPSCRSVMGGCGPDHPLHRETPARAFRASASGFSLIPGRSMRP